MSAAKKYVARAPAEKRRAALAKIHCAKRDLRLDDAMYRALLRRMTGKESAGDLDETGLGAVLDELRRLGFRAPATSEPNQRPSEPAERLAVALWRDLGRLEVLDDPSEAGLGKFARRLIGVPMQWADGRQMNVVIEALKAWRGRERAKSTSQ